jgi:hypothetical protein
MHKGYTIPYFIKFFSDIPVSQWTCGALTNAEELNQGECRSMKACAMGFAGAFDVEKEEYVDDVTGEKTVEYYETCPNTPDRMKRLSQILDGNVESINDNDGHEYSHLGKTPRARILKALRLRQKYGPHGYLPKNRRPE